MSLSDILAGMFQGGARGLGAMYQMEQDELAQKQRKEERADADRRWRETHDMQLAAEMNRTQDRERDRAWQQEKEYSDNLEKIGVYNALPAAKQLAGQRAIGLGQAQDMIGTAGFDALQAAASNRVPGQPLGPRRLQVEGQDTGAFFANMGGANAGMGGDWNVKQDSQNRLWRVDEKTGQVMPLMYPDGKSQMTGMPNWAQTNPYNPNIVATPDGYQWVYRPGMGPGTPRPGGVPGAGGGMPQGVPTGVGGGVQQGPGGVATVNTGVSPVPSQGERAASSSVDEVLGNVQQYFNVLKDRNFKPPTWYDQAFMDQMKQDPTNVVTSALKSAATGLLKPGDQPLFQSAEAVRSAVSALKGGKQLTPFEAGVFSNIVNIRTGETPEMIQSKFGTAIRLLNAMKIAAGRSFNSEDDLAALEAQVKTTGPAAGGAAVAPVDSLKKKYGLED